MTPFILKLAAALRRLWRWPDDHYDVLENGVVAGRIFKVNARSRAWLLIDRMITPLP